MRYMVICVRRSVQLTETLASSRIHPGFLPPTSGLALRLLVHFVADIHQPLHLTSRERGGNGDPVIFERRRTSLHGLWDGLLVTKLVREQHNYTRPLPS